MPTPDIVAALLPDLIRQNPRGSGFSPLPFDPTGAEVRNASRPGDPVQDQLAQGVLDATMLMAPGPPMFGGGRTASRMATPAGIGALGGAGFGAATGGTLEDIQEGALIGGFGGLGLGSAGLAGQALAGSSRSGLANALARRQARASAPSTAVPPVSGAQTRTQLDALGQQINNPNVRAVPGRQGFPTKAEELDELRRIRDEVLGPEQPAASPFAQPATGGGQAQVNADLVRQLQINDRIARALRGG